MRFLRMVCASLLVLALAAPTPAAEPVTRTTSGFLPGGSRFTLAVPEAWNGTLLLYSHGYVVRGAENFPVIAPSPLEKTWLLEHGYALAGSSYASTGWAVDEAVRDQTATLDRFTAFAGRPPRRTIAWGHSMGGLVTALLAERFPDRIAGALPMCGVVAGATPFMTHAAAAFQAFRALALDGRDTGSGGIADPGASAKRIAAVIDSMAATPAGRARLLLVASLYSLPAWEGRFAPEPAPGDTPARETADIDLLKSVALSEFALDADAELIARTGGIPLQTTGVDYAAWFASLPNRREIESAYATAGLDPANDLRAIAALPRPAADRAAAAIVARGDLTGALKIPVVTLHTTGDPLVAVNNETAYAAAIARAGSAAMLERLFVHRAGHCAFTPAEELTALNVLIARLDGGKPSTAAAALNSAAAAFGPDDNTLAGPKGARLPAPSAFIPFTPPPFP